MQDTPQLDYLPAVGATVWALLDNEEQGVKIIAWSAVPEGSGVRWLALVQVRAGHLATMYSSELLPRKGRATHIPAHRAPWWRD